MRSKKLLVPLGKCCFLEHKSIEMEAVGDFPNIRNGFRLA